MKGLGFYSWNLDGLIDPQQTSAIFHALPTGTTGEYEGLSYLGLGNLVILPISLYLFITKERIRRLKFIMLPFAIISFLFTLFALSNQAFLASFLLWNIQLPETIFKIFSMFRASARFIWPVFYFIVVFCLVCLVRNTRFSTLIFALAIGLQLIDLQPLYTSKYVPAGQNYQTELKSEFWRAAAQTSSHVFIYPAEDAFSFYEPLALYTRQNNLTLNWGYFSRANYPEMANIGRHTWEDLKSGHADANTLYIIWSDDSQAQAKQFLSGTMLLCHVDGYEVALSPHHPVVRSGLDLKQYCTFP